jgi:hypothetical protein
VCYSARQHVMRVRVCVTRMHDRHLPCPLCPSRPHPLHSDNVRMMSGGGSGGLQSFTAFARRCTTGCVILFSDKHGGCLGGKRTPTWTLWAGVVAAPASAAAACYRWFLRRWTPSHTHTSARLLLSHLSPPSTPAVHPLPFPPPSLHLAEVSVKFKGVASDPPLPGILFLQVEVQPEGLQSSALAQHFGVTALPSVHFVRPGTVTVCVCLHVCVRVCVGLCGSVHVRLAVCGWDCECGWGCARGCVAACVAV